MAVREKELRAAKAQLQRRDGNAARAAKAEAALAAAKAEVHVGLCKSWNPYCGAAQHFGHEN